MPTKFDAEWARDKVIEGLRDIFREISFDPRGRGMRVQKDPVVEDNGQGSAWASAIFDYYGSDESADEIRITVDVHFEDMEED